MKSRQGEHSIGDSDLQCFVSSKGWILGGLSLVFFSNASHRRK